MTLPAPSATSTAIVTGASSGIGVELARELAGRGHGVTLVARREDRLRSLATDLTDRHGIRAEVVAADLTDPDSRSAILTTLADRGLAVDILVNNAGLSTVGAVAECDPDRELAMVRTDVEAVVHLCSLTIPDMVRRGRGVVLNVASTAAFQPIPGQAGYAASKAFVLSYSQAVGEELVGSGVTVTALCPGPVATEFGDTAGFDPDDVDSSLPKFMWVPASDVARQAVAALDAGRGVVIPGLPNRISAHTAAITPRRVLLPILRRRHPGLKG